MCSKCWSKFLVNFIFLNEGVNLHCSSPMNGWMETGLSLDRILASGSVLPQLFWRHVGRRLFERMYWSSLKHNLNRPFENAVGTGCIHEGEELHSVTGNVIQVNSAMVTLFSQGLITSSVLPSAVTWFCYWKTMQVLPTKRQRTVDRRGQCWVPDNRILAFPSFSVMILEKGSFLSRHFALF